MDHTDDELVEVLLERILAALTPDDLGHLANVLEQDPAGFHLSVSGAVRSMLDAELGQEQGPKR